MAVVGSLPATSPHLWFEYISHLAVLMRLVSLIMIIVMEAMKQHQEEIVLPHHSQIVTHKSLPSTEKKLESEDLVMRADKMLSKLIIVEHMWPITVSPSTLAWPNVSPTSYP